VIDLDLPEVLVADPCWELALEPYLRPLARVVPPGGHWMIEYETEKWRATQGALLAGIPPLATPMGALLHRLDSASSIKDWYFPEGGQEGSRKLQGNRALNHEHARETGARRGLELKAYLAAPARADPGLERRCRGLADLLLGELGIQ
ncbi:MAG: DUF1122 family protein, partial [Candidatus Dormibacteria bacterium]